MCIRDSPQRGPDIGKRHSGDLRNLGQRSGDGPWVATGEHPFHQQRCCYLIEQFYLGHLSVLPHHDAGEGDPLGGWCLSRRG